MKPTLLPIEAALLDGVDRGTYAGKSCKKGCIARATMVNIAPNVDRCLRPVSIEPLFFDMKTYQSLGLTSIERLPRGPLLALLYTSMSCTGLSLRQIQSHWH